MMDVAQNSISAGADLITVEVIEDAKAGRLTVSVKDNGRGMTPQQVENVIDPFYTTRTTRKVGLGVPLFKMAAEQTGGSFCIESKVGEGTSLKAEFNTSHLDMTPLGDINSTVSILIRCNPGIDFVFIHKIDDASFMLDTRELRQILGEEVPLDSPEVMEWIDGFLNEQTQNITEVQ